MDKAGDNVVLYDPEEMYLGSLVTQRQARNRVFSGFTEIRFKAGRVECDYTMSNGRLTSTGTFVIRYDTNDNVQKMAESVTKALGDAFKKFERLS